MASSRYEGELMSHRWARRGIVWGLFVALLGCTSTTTTGGRTVTRTWPAPDPAFSSRIAAVPAPAFDSRRYARIGVIVEPGNTRGVESLIDSAVSLQLLRNGFRVPSRSSWNALIREMQLQHSGVTDRAIADVGRFLNCDGLLIVRADRCDERSYSDNTRVSNCSLSARLVSSETAEVEWQFTGRQTRSISSDELLVRLLEELAASLPLRRRGSSSSVDEAFSSAWGERQITKTAVFVNDFTNKLYGSNHDRMRDSLVAGLLSVGYRVVSRADTDRVLREVEQQMSGITDRAIARGSRILNVEHVVLVDYNVVNNYQSTNFSDFFYASRLNVDVVAKLVDVASSEVLWLRRWRESIRVSHQNGWSDVLADHAMGVGAHTPIR
jgi:hypothetical protein